MKRTLGVLLTTFALASLFLAISTESRTVETAVTNDRPEPASASDRATSTHANVSAKADPSPPPNPAVLLPVDEEQNDDPDLPPRGPRIDKERYLKLRNEYF